MFTTDNGTENFSWPDGGQTPFYGGKGTTFEGGFRAPALLRWPGKVPAGSVANGIFSSQDWFPTLVAAAGNPNIIDELKKGKDLNGTTYKVHIDGVDQTDMITEKGPSKHTEIWYFAESALGAVRIGDIKYTFKEQPNEWIGETITVGAPTIVNLRLDPFERTAWNKGNVGSYQYLNWYQYEFWRFILVQQKVEELAKSALEFPPLQAGASFGLSAVKAQIMEAIQNHGPGYGQDRSMAVRDRTVSLDGRH
jgi:arylsulfatase A-like enzyme